MVTKLAPSLCPNARAPYLIQQFSQSKNPKSARVDRSPLANIIIWINCLMPLINRLMQKIPDERFFPDQAVDPHASVHMLITLNIFSNNISQS